LDLVTIVGLALGFNGDNGFWFRGWVSVATVGLCLGFNGDNGFGFGIQWCRWWVLFWVSVWSGLGFFFSLSLRFSFFMIFPIFATKSGMEFDEFGFCFMNG
jgi:hypothetical protein